MRHPFDCCATKYLCFCINLGQKNTCLTIAIICITLNATAMMNNFGVGHWSLMALSIISFVLHLFGGIVLFLAAIWNSNWLKLIYCWVSFYCVFFVITGAVCYGIFRKDLYSIFGEIWHTRAHFTVAIQSTWLVFWNVYSTMVVLGNTITEKKQEEKV